MYIYLRKYPYSTEKRLLSFSRSDWRRPLKERSFASFGAEKSVP
jgi:hypothetical protein